MTDLASRTAPQASYDPAYFARLFAIEDRHFWFRARNQMIGAVARQVTANLPPGYRVLEAGCGTGTVLRELERVCTLGHVVGMDLFAEGLRFARQRVHCPLAQGDIHNPPFREPFHVIGLFDVLEHLPDDLAVLRALHAMLLPGGALLLTVPAHASLWSYFDEASHHCRRYELPDLESKLHAAGFTVEYATQAMAALFPLVWLGRRVAAWTSRHRKTPERADTLAENELRITPIVNELLTMLLSLEARAIARRRRLPLGSSLLAIARRTPE